MFRERVAISLCSNDLNLLVQLSGLEGEHGRLLNFDEAGGHSLVLEELTYGEGHAVLSTQGTE